MSSRSPVSKLEEKVHRAIQAKDLVLPGEGLVVAVSGGPDSVALLGCLVALSSRWNWKLRIGHINHGLRDLESEEDAAFVERLGHDFDVPVSVRKAVLSKHEVHLSNQSLQAYARHIRYQALEAILQECGATKIATGHTVDDQAETVLMWMLRGSGTGGLSGIPPKRGMQIVRPLLDISRKEVLEYLQARGLSYRMDSSNYQTVYMRNDVRKHLMPQLKKFSPRIVTILSRQADLIREDHGYLEQVAHEAFQQLCVSRDESHICLDRAPLLALPMAIQRRVVRQAIFKMTGVSQSPRFNIIQGLLDQMAHGQSGWVRHIQAINVAREYDRVVFSKRENLTAQDVSAGWGKAIKISIPGEVVWPLTGQRMKVSLKPLPEVASQHHSLETHFDGATFTPELHIRSWSPGDVFCPKGMGGRQKKLQDFFSDIKLPRSQREKVPLLVSPEGILWVAGIRGDERFQASSITTSVVLATMTY